MKRRKRRTLSAIKANPGLRVQYRKELEALIKEMRDDLMSTMESLLPEEVEPKVAQDAKAKVSAALLDEQIQRLKAKWAKRFGDLAFPISMRFIGGINSKVRRTRERAIKEALGNIGINMTPSQISNDRFQALIRENANLIKTIPEQYLNDVQGKVMRSVSSGLDRYSLLQDIQGMIDDGKTRLDARAALISRDQSNKATQALTRSIDEDLGITEAVWIHRAGRKMSRETHIAMNGKTFNLNEGLYDSQEGKKVVPGECILCNCTYRPVFPKEWEEL